MSTVIVDCITWAHEITRLGPPIEGARIVGIRLDDSYYPPQVRLRIEIEESALVALGYRRGGAHAWHECVRQISTPDIFPAAGPLYGRGTGRAIHADPEPWPTRVVTPAQPTPWDEAVAMAREKAAGIERAGSKLEAMASITEALADVAAGAAGYGDGPFVGLVALAAEALAWLESTIAMRRAHG